ncbi:MULTISPECIES: peptidase inhibitor family I36 protein [unclassified Streptomyces]|uniref:peptidase inhibitor family I36 protein n=1 Tax=unclassified Streptomyces TaxID=2593676 RepID=UPI00278C05A0|nr:MULTISPECIES: peptidase inhibitor family I36 protein [unclassified Streptomyces]
MRHPLALVTAVVLALGGAAVTTSAYAAQCPSGEFCAWTDANYAGMRWNWSGDDQDWEGDIQDADSSWANHGITGPGVKDHVQVYENPGLVGLGTVCLGPGQEIASDDWANDSGDSHTWTMEC